MLALNLPDHPVLRKWRAWRELLRIARPIKAEAIAVLDRRHVYILPTRQGVLFAVVLACMLVGSINYALSLGFVLTFLLAGLSVIAMLLTWRNLAYLEIAAGKTLPVFAGETAHFGLTVSDRAGRQRDAIAFSYRSSDIVYADLPANGTHDIVIEIPSERRGWLKPGRLTVHTEFPLGLFRAWSYAELDQRCLVYPQPASADATPLWSSAATGQSGKTTSAGGDDDFAGLRPYQRGDSLKRIDWKSSSREQGFFTKQFQGTSRAQLWLDWQLAEGDTETRLALLTRWLLDAHSAGLTYGLRLPGLEIPPAVEEDHFRRCLEALALFGISK